MVGTRKQAGAEGKGKGDGECIRGVWRLMQVGDYDGRTELWK